MRRSHVWTPVGMRTRWSSALAWPLMGGALAWLLWPVLASNSAPMRDDVQAVLGWVIAALAVMACGLSVLHVADKRGRIEAVFPIIMGTAAFALTRVVLSPGRSGVEPVFVVPLIIGASLGSGPGVAVGMLGGLASAVLTDTLATPLPGQMIVFALWGAIGGLLTRLDGSVLRLVGAVACLVLGSASGLLLNLTGWVNDQASFENLFIPGLLPADQFERLVGYTRTSSAGIDVARGVTNAVVWLLVSWPIVRRIRGRYGFNLAGAPPQPPFQALNPDAVKRRTSFSAFSLTQQGEDRDK